MPKVSTPYRFVPMATPIYRSLRRVVHTLAFRGDRVSCPMCGGEWRAFTGERRIGNCPGCEGASRHRMLWLSLERRHPELLANPKRILHFAAEPCIQRRFRAMKRHTYTTIDLAERGMDVTCDITDLVFEDGSYDLVLCNHVLEHVPDDRKALAELYRVLSPGGHAMIMVPFEHTKRTDEDPSIVSPAERKRRFGQHDHVRVYGFDFPDRIRSAGFEVTIERVYRELSEAERARFGLWDDVVFCCRKPRDIVARTVA